MGPRRLGRGEEQAQPDPEQRAERRVDEDHRRPLGPVAPWRDLPDVGVDDREIGADRHAGNHAGEHEVGVVRRQRVPQRADPGEQHRHQQHVAAADLVREGAEEERARHVAGQVERDGDADCVECGLRSTARLEREAALDERHVDVEHVVEGEKEAEADDPDEQERHRPHVEAVEPGQHPLGRVAVGSRAPAGGSQSPSADVDYAGGARACLCHVASSLPLCEGKLDLSVAFAL